MLHLIVEACIARKVIDTSAYFWPGYVNPSTTSKESMLIEESPWSAFIEGSQLTGSLKNVLMKTPASSLVELEKLYYTAVNGLEEEKFAAANALHNTRSLPWPKDHEKKLDEDLAPFDAMLEIGIRPDAISFLSVLSLCIPGTLISGGVVHRDVELGEIAANRLILLNEDDASNDILPSSLYTVEEQNEESLPSS